MELGEALALDLYPMWVGVGDPGAGPAVPPVRVPGGDVRMFNAAFNG